MKITVTHSTVYSYDAPVIVEPHIFRFQPRMSSTHRLIAFDLQITPTPAGTSECLDQDGNLALNAWFHAPTRELSVRSHFTVEMLRQNPFDYVLTGESLALPLWYREPLSTALAPYRSDEQVAESVKQYAKTLGPPWSSERTLSSLEGSCRDLAVLFCDACRVMGIAARFVSGYECASANCMVPYMHAWAEVYLPGIGWRGYDPARGLAVSNGHVAVAAGFDYDLASPVAGWYSGESGSRMETLLNLQVQDAA